MSVMPFWASPKQAAGRNNPRGSRVSPATSRQSFGNKMFFWIVYTKLSKKIERHRGGEGGRLGRMQGLVVL